MPPQIGIVNDQTGWYSKSRADNSALERSQLERTFAKSISPHTESDEVLYSTDAHTSRDGPQEDYEELN
jgi:hypothetical protein